MPVLQICWSVPAFTPNVLFRMFTWLDDEQLFSTTVHWKTLFPPPRPVTPEVAKVGFVTVPPPPETVQDPVPWDGRLAWSVALFEHTVWFAPAAETTWSLRIEVVLEAVQEPWDTVHWKLFAPRESPVTALAALVGADTAPLPVRTLHVPTPCKGGAPFRLLLPVQLTKAGPALETTLLSTTNRLALWVHALLDTVHVKMLLPSDRFVTAVLATPACWMLEPLSVLQLPVPMLGNVALSCAEFVHTSMLEDTWAVDGLSFTMLTKSVAVQPFLLTVHWNVLRPNWRRLTALLGWFNCATVPEPVAKLHAPVSPGFRTALRTAVVPQTLWSEPALAVKLLLKAVTDELLLHWPWTTVQMNTFAPVDRPVTLLFRLLGLWTAPVPTVDHEPVPWTGLAAPRVAVVPHTVWFVPAFDDTVLLVIETSL